MHTVGQHVIRSLVIGIILLVVLINTAHAGDPGRWVYDLFRSSVTVTLYDDGSGVAIDAEGAVITFCVAGEACDTRADTPHRATSDGETVTVTRRRH